MKRLWALAGTVFLTIFFVVAVHAAPGGTAGAANNQQGAISASKAAAGSTATSAKVPLGLKNAKKAMQGKIERDKKMLDVQKKGQAKRKQAQAGK